MAPPARTGDREGGDRDVAGDPHDRAVHGAGQSAQVAAATLVLQAVWEDAIADLGPAVPPVQLRALLAIDLAGTLNLNALARRLRTSASAASRLCDRLEQAGLITRTKHFADRRGIILSLSGAGEQLVRWAHARHRERLQSVLEAMRPGAREALVQGLEEFQHAVMQVAADADTSRQMMRNRL
jgi:DNA-binding MarR family transcriptional regulator